MKPFAAHVEGLSSLRATGWDIQWPFYGAEFRASLHAIWVVALFKT